MVKKKADHKLFERENNSEYTLSHNLIILFQICGVVFIFLILAFLFIFVTNVSSPRLSSEGRILGNIDAPVEIILWSDFECPFCSQFATDILPQLEREYISTGKVKLSYKYFLGHADSKRAAMAAECANEQGKFWEYHDKLYSKMDLSDRSFKIYAVDLGLNSSKFNDCLGGEKYGNSVEQEFLSGINIGVKGTPSVFINGTFIEGLQSYSSYKGAIDLLLSKS